jgi:hypothetical protein
LRQFVEDLELHLDDEKKSTNQVFIDNRTAVT